MYCSACGVAVTQGLSYCNFCGAKLARASSSSRSPEVKPELLVTSMVAVFVFGTAAITGLMAVAKAVLAFETGPLLALLLLCFLIMLGLEGVFIRLLMRRSPRTDENTHHALMDKQATNELDARAAPALSESIGSVTEHTTRAFQPIVAERNRIR